MVETKEVIVMDESAIARELMERFKGELEGQEALNFVSGMFDQIQTALAAGDRVEIRNFGSFKVKMRSARQVKNPKTGLDMDVPEHCVVSFKPSSLIVSEIKNQKQSEKKAKKPVK